jgi:hypothetical protein
MVSPIEYSIHVTEYKFLIAFTITKENYIINIITKINEMLLIFDIKCCNNEVLFVTFIIS